jgi:hypothetical protein
MQRSPIELDSLIKARHNAVLLESVQQAGSKIVEKFGSISIRMTRGQEVQHSPMVHDSLVKV